MSLKALSEYTFVSKYARYLPEKKRRETWDEAVNRVRDMHLEFYADKIKRDGFLGKDIHWAFERIREKRVLGSQRALQFGGKPILKKHARIYNCTSSYCDRLRFFQECLFLLLAGCGTGFSVQQHHVEKLPEFLSGVKKGNKQYTIDDSIEGWANALGVLLSSYFPGGDFPEYENYFIEFIYDEIRPEGSPLSSCSGKAPGPGPLRNALNHIRQLLDNCILQGQRKLKPINAYDIVMHSSDAVLSGGVRRSATIALFSLEDEEMAQAKTGNWLVENLQRSRSNNSVVLIRNETSKEQFESLMKYVKEFGEPGFVWADSKEFLVNPCVEIGYTAIDYETGKTGWCFCNLCEINGGKLKSKEDFKIAAKAAAIIGTLQAGYTNFDYLGETTQNIVRREALLGVSITGMMDNPEIAFDYNLQMEMAQYILSVNEEIAKKIDINPTARATCTKPSGTTSCFLGTASGIHPHHATRYIRHAQGNRLEPPLQYFKSINPMAVEKSVWSANDTDEVISFCVEVGHGAKIKNQIDAITLLSYVKETQQHWVTGGKNIDRCVQPYLSHNVSNTITVKDDEWNEVSNFIYENRQYFAGVSLLPFSGDKDYPQAPFLTVHTPREVVQMYGDGSLMASGVIVDGLKCFDNNLWAACDAVLGTGKPILKPEISEHTSSQYVFALKAFHDKIDWVRRAKQFAVRYFDGDIRQMTFCSKDVHIWKHWCDLNREYKDVDYSLMVEDEDNTNVMGEWACSGGICELKAI
jgi:ribonucleoside-diphosphate reductase alpha chain